MKFISGIIFLILIFCLSCEKDNWGARINPVDSLSFGGRFATAAYYGKVYLHISNGKYVCNTSLPFGNGAGYLIADGNTIEFRDTLYFIIPLVYGPSFVLGGKYGYLYDGKELLIQKNVNGGIIKYELELLK